jgi:hypothetical protein
MSDFTITRGATVPFGPVPVVDSITGAPFAIAGKLFRFTIKRSFSDQDSAALLRLTSESSRITLDTVGNTVSWSIETTDNLLKGPIASQVTLVWELKLKDPAAGRDYPLDSGRLFVSPDVLVAG